MENKNIVLRNMSLEDINQLIDFFDDYDDYKYFRYDKFYSYVDKMLYFKTRLNDTDFFTEFIWSIILKETNEVIGFIALNRVDKYEAKGSVSYFLLKEYRGNNYMVQALSLVIKFAFEKLKLHKLKAFVVDENINSKKVLEKLNFKLEGTLIDEVTLEKEYYTNCLYALINEGC